MGGGVSGAPRLMAAARADPLVGFHSKTPAPHPQPAAEQTLPPAWPGVPCLPFACLPPPSLPPKPRSHACPARTSRTVLPSPAATGTFLPSSIATRAPSASHGQLMCTQTMQATTLDPVPKWPAHLSAATASDAARVGRRHGAGEQAPRAATASCRSRPSDHCHRAQHMRTATPQGTRRRFQFPRRSAAAAEALAPPRTRLTGSWWRADGRHQVGGVRACNKARVGASSRPHASIDRVRAAQGPRRHRPRPPPPSAAGQLTMNRCWCLQCSYPASS